MKISIICPGRNNLKYAKWSYDSIQKNKGDHEVEYCFFDDASTDGTDKWCEEMAKKDPNFKYIKNDTSERVGHTIGYDRLVNEVATNDMCMIFHADMYLCPGSLDAIEKNMYKIPHSLSFTARENIDWNGLFISGDINKKTIVSLTRIEPPLHPSGPEKILLDCGVEPEEFDEIKLLMSLAIPMVNNKETDFTKYGCVVQKGKTTEGIFARWAFWKEDFQEIGGHDPLYRPQSKEDSDIFNRFQLNGVKFIQTWEGFVYHMTCRGSRRNTFDKAKNIYEDSPEWLAQNQKSTRNFIRKFGHFVKHDKYMKPIVPNKYNVGITITASNLQLVDALEPWCDNIYVQETFTVGRAQDYIEKEQGNTDYDLSTRVHTELGTKVYPTDDVTIDINGNTFNNQDFMYIQQLSEILDEQGEVGNFQLGNLDITVNKLKTYTKDLIKINTPYNT